MSKKDEFKLFASKHPELVKYIKNGESSWQKFYEIYDIYGEDSSAWSDYLQAKTTTNDYNLKNITDKIKNMDFNSIQEHISTAQKALGIVQELTTKGSKVENVAGLVNPRPINKIFED
jgi:hypothetical protein